MPDADDSFDVELLPEELEERPARAPAPRRGNPESEPSRGLLELDRRDFLMMGLGAGGMIGAILTGYGMAQLMRRRNDSGPSEPPTSPPEETPPARANE